MKEGKEVNYRAIGHIPGNMDGKIPLIAVATVFAPPYRSNGGDNGQHIPPTQNRSKLDLRLTGPSQTQTSPLLST